jgi:catecholate siderophore receptor
MTRTFRKFRQNRPIALTPIGYVAIKKGVSAGLVPLGVLLLASSMTAMAQQDVPDGQKSLKPVVVKEKAEAPEGKDAVAGHTNQHRQGHAAAA